MSECRFCFNSEKGVLVTPCRCNGTIKHIHQSCLMKWLKEKYPLKCYALLKHPDSKNTGIQCELCKYEFKGNIKYLHPLQILSKLKNSSLTYCVLMNIPIIVYLAYKCNYLLRHLFLFIYDQGLILSKNTDLRSKAITVLKFYLRLCAKLFPVSIVATVLPMILHSTYSLCTKLYMELKVIQFENIM
jgi:RING-variant domain